MSEIINLEDDADRWKWVCPHGHRSWEPTNHHFWCATCARSLDVDGVFYELRNLATDDLYERGDVRLMTPMGPYANEQEVVADD